LIDADTFLLSSSVFFLLIIFAIKKNSGCCISLKNSGTNLGYVIFTEITSKRSRGVFKIMVLQSANQNYSKCFKRLWLVQKKYHQYKM